MKRYGKYLAGALTALWMAAPGFASPFGDGWTLEADASTLQFQSIKKGSIIETSSFAALEGAIDADGQTSFKVLLDSIDTKIDLRNVRMRFLFFETFVHPEASISARIDPADLADLASVRRKTITLPFSITLHGVTKELETDLVLTLIRDDLVSVSSSVPIVLELAEFDLIPGLEKLQDAAKVTIVPSTVVSFDLVFKAVGGAPVQLAALTEQPVRSTQVALEAEGDFSESACLGRFEILSRTNEIYFAPSSAELEDRSFPLLDAVADIVERCPNLNIRVEGHTDSQGARTYNQKLSERRAGSVVEYLSTKGIASGRMTAIGFGEDRPIATNSTRKGRWKNRRIEFSVPKT
jgi:outer membrane protein OmpA-like peptidoglycan-associated protein